jgi:hypothetical protein
MIHGGAILDRDFQINGFSLQENANKSRFGPSSPCKFFSTWNSNYSVIQWFKISGPPEE